MTNPTDPSRLRSTSGVARPRVLGWWKPSLDDPAPVSDLQGIAQHLSDLRTGFLVVQTGTELGIVPGGDCRFVEGSAASEMRPLWAVVPPLAPDQLGDPAFRAQHQLKYAYMTGAMANGIASADIVIAMGQAGMLGSFGAAGLSLERIREGVTRIQSALKDRPFAVNLIHSPNEPGHESATAELLMAMGVRRVEASAYLDLTPAIVHYRVAGLQRDTQNQILATNMIIAKVSRVEVASKFLSPAPERILKELLAAGKITPQQAELARHVPMCDDLTAEADSGGHTDNRPAITLLPTMLALRDRLQEELGYTQRVRVGLAGGLSTPASLAAAFAMGADYVVTGSVNQACLESGSSDLVRKMLAEAGQADVTMAPAADMFEMGVKLQVLKRGTMFAMRAQKLYETYRQYTRWEDIPAADRAQLEKSLFKASYDEIWAQTRDFFSRRDPVQLARAEQDPRHQMALVFRWYLGLSSRWANSGEPTRTLDYQVWCGPAMGAFNEWVKGTHLEAPAERKVVHVARNLLYGAGIVLRKQALEQQGVRFPAACYPLKPLPSDILDSRI